MNVRFAVLLVLLAGFIVLPFALWDENMLQLTKAWLNSTQSTWVLAVLIVVLLALDVVLPTPSSLVSLAAGVYFSVAVAAALVTVGMILGCLLGYGIGRALGRPGRWIRSDDLAAAERFFQRYGLAALTIARPIPVLAEASVILAGITRVRFVSLIVYTLPANLAVGIVYALSGQVIKEHSIALVLLVVAVLGALMLAIVRQRHDARE